MSNKIFATLLAVALTGSTLSFAQEMKTEKKEHKAVKKEMKGKHHKAMKKEVKAEKKDAMAK